MSRWFRFLVPTLLVVPSPLLADGLVRTLPPDGSWVEYHSVLTIGATESNGTTLLRVVGTENVAGKPCRWIEVELRPANDGEQRQIYKMLIRPEGLRTGADPLDHVVRAWSRTGDDDVQAAEAREIDIGFVGAMLHGALMDVKRLDETRRLPWQRGAFESRGTTGRRTFQVNDTPFTLVSTAWPHDDVPFGVAALSVDIRTKDSTTTIQLELTVNDFGRDAKSALPDAS